MIDFAKYLFASKNSNFSISATDSTPCLFDNTKNTPLDPTYFLQDTWAAKKVFETNPKRHYDVGSSATTVGIIAQYVPTVMIDIRPLPIKLSGLDFVKGSILNLPFKSGSINSISSICVIEHIGLGRYGDDIDQFGSEKAVLEVQRVVKGGGHIIVSVPIDSKCKIYFNAHRSFTRNYVLSLFDKCKLVEEQYIYGKEIVKKYQPKKGFGTGLYLFQKQA